MGFFNSLFNKNAQAKVSSHTQHYRDIWSDKDYQRISKQYYSQLETIESEWSVMYNLKNFQGDRAKRFITLCLKNVDLYKQLATIENSYGQDAPPSSPGFKRLAMIYEKQKLYDLAASVCVDALAYGAYADNMKGRLARMIRKAKLHHFQKNKFF